MFPHDYFAAGAFAPDYFPPVADGVPPVAPPARGGRTYSIPAQPPVLVDEFGDDEFLTWFT